MVYYEKWQLLNLYWRMNAAAPIVSVKTAGDYKK